MFTPISQNFPFWLLLANWIVGREITLKQIVWAWGGGCDPVPRIRAGQPAGSGKVQPEISVTCQQAKCPPKSHQACTDRADTSSPFVCLITLRHTHSIHPSSNPGSQKSTQPAQDSRLGIICLSITGLTHMPSLLRISSSGSASSVSVPITGRPLVWALASTE